jgi:hypothetical protein
MQSPQEKTNEEAISIRREISKRETSPRGKSSAYENADCRAHNCGAKMRTSRTRSAPKRYLQKVYRVFWQWELEDQAKLRAWAAARSAKVSFRPDAHPLKLLIDATSGLKDRKDRSRYGRALQAAVLKQVDPDDLHLFFEANGGLAGCARLFASLSDHSNVL